jgi:Rps23 Pro-64 3,4-dihydroxylase Tpa1-like proline 4-hydroxylase
MKWISTQHQAKDLAARYQEAKPFAHLQLQQFFTQDKLELVADSLFEEQFHEKYADLFHMCQTSDLKSSTQGAMQSFHQFVKEELVPFMEEVSGLSLSREHIDLQGAIYADGNYLLCHDDQLDSRAIAFMLYLTDLEEGEGGELLLYDSKEDKPDPDKVTKVRPQENLFVAFTVSKTSFHEVAEVLADTQRVTIGGWLHHA